MIIRKSLTRKQLISKKLKVSAVKGEKQREEKKIDREGKKARYIHWYSNCASIINEQQAALLHN